MSSTDRRSFVAGLAGALVAAPARAAPGPADVIASRHPLDLQVLDIDVGGDKKLATRFTLFVPRHLGKGERVPLLILFHGLGETGDPVTGVYAWVERYGLGTAYARLLRPPIIRTSRQPGLLPDARLAQLNASLATQPFRGMVVACPYTPNVAMLTNPVVQLDAYALWITDVVLPRARQEAPVIADPAHTAIDGVSLGGHVGLEVFLRRPEAFAAWGGVQSALHAVRLPSYASRLAAALGGNDKTSIHLETTEGDPFRTTNVALAAMLRTKGVANDLRILPGQHDQVFLRESGTLEMLLWHDRRMR